MYANIGKQNKILSYNLRENYVLKNMAKWTKVQDTQIIIPQNTYASIYMMAKLKDYRLKLKYI